MTKTHVTIILILIILICIIKSKHTPIIIKNNIIAFLIQTFISTLAIIFASSLSAEIYECNSSIIIYNKPSDGFWKKFFTEAFFCESIIRIICMILFVIFGMSLIKQKSKLKNLLSVFICYLILIIIELIYPLYFENIYIWVPYIFINSSIHAEIQKATPLIYNIVFYILLFIPTFFMWIGIELKGISVKKIIKRIYK